MSLKQDIINRKPQPFGVFDILGLLALSAVSALVLLEVYLPSLERRREAAIEYRDMVAEVNRLQQRNVMLKQYRDKLAAAEPETIEQALRRQLRWGRKGEFLLPIDEQNK